MLLSEVFARLVLDAASKLTPPSSCGHPGTICTLPFSFALMLMRQQNLNVDLSTANSLRVTVSKRVAESMGTRVPTHQPTEAEKKKAMAMRLDQPNDLSQHVLELLSIKATDSGHD